MHSMIKFTEPFITGNEERYIGDTIANKALSGDGPYTAKCSQVLESITHTQKVLLTPSCTAALEMAAILFNIQPGDEIIMPSFTFSSSANAFLLRGAVPVFVDIDDRTLCIDPNKIEAAITPKTRAIMAVHYAGAACDMDAIMAIANKHTLYVVEDAAQSLCSSYKGRHPGAIGHLGCLSFHATKNIIAGEGGALLINDKSLMDRAEIIREKGTNRKQFLRGDVDKYTWQEMGSSYLPSEPTAAFLYAQLEQAETITKKRVSIWNRYQTVFKEQLSPSVKTPFIPDICQHNAHIYYLILPTTYQRNLFIEKMKQNNIQCTFHYAPLHLSPAGSAHGRTHGTLSQTETIADCLVRLPLHNNLTETDVDTVIQSTIDIIQSLQTEELCA